MNVMTKKTHRQFAFITTSPCLKQYAFCALLFLFCLLSLKSCSPTELVFQDHEIHLHVDAEVTEAWINLCIDGLEQNAVYIVTRDDSIVYRKKCMKRKKLIHDINLVPGRNYTYKAYAKFENMISDTVELSITTMDSTNSNFNISYTIVKSAQLRHCWIWDSNNYWIIGEYYPNDSTGASKGLHNILAYEDGKWSDTAVKYEAGWSSPLPITETSGFWAFDKSDVWFAMYNIKHWTGGIAQIIFDGGQKHKLFGFDDNVLYAAGRKGQIMKITPNEIQSIDLPENYYLSDIWGDKDKNLGLTVFESSAHKRLLIFLKNDEIEEIEYECLDNPNTLWFKNRDKIFKKKHPDKE